MPGAQSLLRPGAIGHRRQHAVRSVFVVGERHGGQDAAVTADAEVEAAVFAQPVGGLIPRRPGPGDVHQDLRRVEAAGRLGAKQLVLEHLDVGDFGQPAAQVAGEIEFGAEQFVTVLDHLAPPTVERRIDHHVRARRHQQVGTRGQPCRVDQIALQMKDRACSNLAPILCTLTTQTSAPASIACRAGSSIAKSLRIVAQPSTTSTTSPNLS